MSGYSVANLATEEELGNYIAKSSSAAESQGGEA